MSQFWQGVTTGNLPPSVPLQFTTNSGIAVPALNNLNVFGGTGATTSGSGSTITITVANDGFAWSEKSGNFAAVNQNGYFCNTGLTVTLPAGVATGNTIIIYVDTASAVTITATGGNLLQIGQNTSGANGSTTSTAKGNQLELVFKLSDVTWHSINSMGVWDTTM